MRQSAMGFAGFGHEGRGRHAQSRGSNIGGGKGCAQHIAEITFSRSAQDVDEHRRRRRFAMTARHADIETVGDQLGQHLGAGLDGNAVASRRPPFHMGLGNGRAYHDAIRSFHTGRIGPRKNLDLLCFQHSKTRGGAEIVAAGDRVARLLEQQRQRQHAAAPDTDQMHPSEIRHRPGPP